MIRIDAVFKTGKSRVYNKKKYLNQEYGHNKRSFIGTENHRS